MPSSSVGIDRGHWAHWYRQRLLPDTVSPSKRTGRASKTACQDSELPGTRYCVNTILIIASNLQIPGSLSVNRERNGAGDQGARAWEHPRLFLASCLSKEKV